MKLNTGCGMVKKKLLKKRMENYLNQPATIFDKYFTEIKIKDKGFKGFDQVWIRYQCL